MHNQEALSSGPGSALAKCPQASRDGGDTTQGAGGLTEARGPPACPSLLAHFLAMAQAGAVGSGPPLPHLRSGADHGACLRGGRWWGLKNRQDCRASHRRPSFHKQELEVQRRERCSRGHTARQSGIGRGAT